MPTLRVNFLIDRNDSLIQPFLPKNKYYNNYHINIKRVIAEFTTVTILFAKHHYQKHIKPQKPFKKKSLSTNKNIQSGYTERVFLYCHGPTDHKVLLVGSILQVLQRFMVSLECKSLASQIQLEVSNTQHYCQALLCDRVLSFCQALLLAGVPTGYSFPSFSCNSTAAFPTPEASVLRTNDFIRSGTFNTCSCSRYSLRQRVCSILCLIPLYLF